MIYLFVSIRVNCGKLTCQAAFLECGVYHRYLQETAANPIKNVIFASKGTKLTIDLRAICFIYLLFAVFSSQAQIISTFAGTGVWGNEGDGGPATTATLGTPLGMVADNAGNVYICNPANSTIRVVNSAGIITKFAGTGVQGYTGDGGPATAAWLNSPEDIARDKAGNTYFIDQKKAVIRKINTSGIISTITGNLPEGYSGDGGPLNQARFNKICAIAFDTADNLYIADGLNYVIRKVNTAGIITTIAGDGSGGFSGDGGPATAARFFYPRSIAVDLAGNVFVADINNYRVRKIDINGIITTYAGSAINSLFGDGGPATSAGLCEPISLSIDNAQNLYIADRICNSVRKVTPAGIITTYAGIGQLGYTGDGGPANMARVQHPYGITIDESQSLYIASGSNVVRKVAGCVAYVTAQPTDATVCENNSTAFAITAVDALAFQWQVYENGSWINLADNAVYAGTASSSLQIHSANLTMTGKRYRCRISNSCGDIFSAAAMLSVLTPQPASVSISTQANPVCNGQDVLFTAIAVNGGSLPLYQWKKNGANTGTGSSIVIDVATSDIITCSLISNSNCITTNTANSNEIVMSVKTPPSHFLPGDSSVCSYSSIMISAVGGYSSYRWNDNTNLSSLNITQPGVYWLEVTDMYGCKGRDSIIITPKDCMHGIYIPSAFTPNNDGINDIFKPVVFADLSLYRFKVFNRYGQVIFETTDLAKGWDGTLKGMPQNTGGFTWMCMYQIAGKLIENKQGSVQLIR